MVKDYRKAKDIIQEALDISGVEMAWLLRGRRTKTLGQFRQSLVKRLRKDTNLSWREIGLLTGYHGRAWLSKS